MKYKVGDKVRYQQFIGTITIICDNRIYIKWNDGTPVEKFYITDVDRVMKLLKPTNEPDRSSA